MIYIDIDILTDKIQFSIFRYFSNTKKVIRRDEIVLPRCYNTAQKLNYVRNLVSIFIEEDNIKYYKIHIGDLENNEDVKKILDDMEEAIKMEGVLEELFISRGVEKWK